jgi:hypothetical protein
VFKDDKVKASVAGVLASESLQSGAEGPSRPHQQNI